MITGFLGRYTSSKSPVPLQHRVNFRVSTAWRWLRRRAAATRYKWPTPCPSSGYRSWATPPPAPCWTTRASTTSSPAPCPPTPCRWGWHSRWHHSEHPFVFIYIYCTRVYDWDFVYVTFIQCLRYLSMLISYRSHHLLKQATRTSCKSREARKTECQQ